MTVKIFKIKITAHLLRRSIVWSVWVIGSRFIQKSKYFVCDCTKKTKTSYRQFCTKWYLCFFFIDMSFNIRQHSVYALQQSSNKWSVLLILKWKSHVRNVSCNACTITPTPASLISKIGFICTKCDERFLFFFSFWFRSTAADPLLKNGNYSNEMEKTFETNKTINLSNDTYRYKT